MHIDISQLYGTSHVFSARARFLVSFTLRYLEQKHQQSFSEELADNRKNIFSTNPFLHSSSTFPPTGAD